MNNGFFWNQHEKISIRINKNCFTFPIPFCFQWVDFGDEESFREKLNTLKESYFPKSTVVEQKFDDEDGTAAKDIDTTEAMSAYLSAISRNQKASA